MKLSKGLSCQPPLWTYVKFDCIFRLSVPKNPQNEYPHWIFVDKITIFNYRGNLLRPSPPRVTRLMVNFEWICHQSCFYVKISKIEILKHEKNMLKLCILCEKSIESTLRGRHFVRSKNGTDFELDFENIHVWDPITAFIRVPFLSRREL